MEIIKYNNSKNMDILFSDGYISKNKSYKDFKNKNLKSPFFPSIYNKGYIGEGIYKSIKDIWIYNKWINMFKRCYDEKYQDKYSTYKDCTIDEKWYNFQNFAEWCIKNLWSKDCNFLDKDILFKGNRIYSPETCILVDNRINCLFTNRKNYRGEYPIGVYYKKKNKKFVAQCNINYNINKNIQYHLGYFNTPKEAFQAYKSFKESYIKQVADEYAQKYPNFPQKLYDAMYNYQVEIDD